MELSILSWNLVLLSFIELSILEVCLDLFYGIIYLANIPCYLHENISCNYLSWKFALLFLMEFSILESNLATFYAFIYPSNIPCYLLRNQVSYLEVSLAIQQKVLWLEIPVYEVKVVKVFKGQNNLSRVEATVSFTKYKHKISKYIR